MLYPITIILAEANRIANEQFASYERRPSEILDATSKALLRWLNEQRVKRGIPRVDPDTRDDT